jgi:hypothetical protein
MATLHTVQKHVLQNKPHCHNRKKIFWRYSANRNLTAENKVRIGCQNVTVICFFTYFNVMVGVHTNLLAPQVKGKLACVLQKKTIGRRKKQCANLAARIIF